jgi:hypothetical protein
MLCKNRPATPSQTLRAAEENEHERYDCLRASKFLKSDLGPHVFLTCAALAPEKTAHACGDQDDDDSPRNQHGACGVVHKALSLLSGWLSFVLMIGTGFFVR